MFFYPTNADEILHLISSFKNKKSAGIDGLVVGTIKKVADVICYPLVFIVNMSLETGKFPSQMKEAVVVPIFKSNDKKILGNYRPITLLPIFSKLLEKVVKIQLVNYLESTHFFSANQFGFKKGLSTEDALLNFISKLIHNKNDGNKTAGLFLDFQKAFDVIEHDILLNKLWMAGIRGVCSLWFRSYLSDRDQRVRVDNVLSEIGEVKYGVPQGSVLGPVLFLVILMNYVKVYLEGKLPPLLMTQDFPMYHPVTQKLRVIWNLTCEL